MHLATATKTSAMCAGMRANQWDKVMCTETGGGDGDSSIARILYWPTK